MLLVLGGATGTWAFVHHLGSREVVQPVTAPLPEEMEPVVEQAEPVRKLRRTNLSSPAAERAEKAVKKEKKPPLAPRTKHAKKNKPGALEPGPEVIVVPSRVSGDDHVILVSPPAKLGPLWTPETYKKRGVR
jgi:hypothetical protein